MLVVEFYFSGWWTINSGKDLQTFVRFADNYLWIFRNRFENRFAHINPEVFFYECNPLDADNLGNLLFEHKGKYHKTCKLRYSYAKVDRYKKPTAVKPPAKAAKRERHVSAHDNVEEALKNAGIEAVRDLIMDQEKVSPGLHPVADREKHYNDYVTANFPEHLISSGGIRLVSKHEIRFAERIELAIPELKHFVIRKIMFVCFDGRVVAALAATLDTNEDKYRNSCSQVSGKIRKERKRRSRVYLPRGQHTYRHRSAQLSNYEKSQKGL